MMIPASSGQSGSSRRSAEPVDIWKARNFIHQHSSDKISLTNVARAVKVNPSHLSEKFKQVTGVNFVDYIARTRFEHACLRLRDNNARISEIAFEVGFQSLSQFGRVFKKLAGKTPTAYRLRWQKGRSGKSH
jgi:AraC-like DNA-binding protein